MPPKKRTRSSLSDTVSDANDQSHHKQTNTVNIRPAKEVVRRNLPRKQHGATTAIRPSKQTIDFLLMYPFVLPLVVLLLNDADVLTSLLVTCKTIKLVIKQYEIKLSIDHSIACRLLDVNRYLPSIVIAIHGVYDVALLASFPSLVQVKFLRILGRLSLADLPRSIKRLTLTSRFNQPIDPGDLPDGLETLILERTDFNQPIPVGVLPSSLKTLKLGDAFSQPFDAGCLPDSLTVLDLGYSWNRPLMPGIIPHAVSRLVFGYCFNQPIVEHALPPSLTSLTLGFHFSQTLEHLPSSVSRLSLHCHAENLIIPHSVTHLFSHLFTYNVKIPRSVTHLVTAGWKVTPRSIPDSVTHLRFDEDFNGDILPGMIPSSVVHLRFGSCFNRAIKPGILPNSLVDLTFGEGFDRALGPDVLPASLKTLTVPVNHTKRISVSSSDTLIIHADVDEAVDAWWL